MCVCRFKFRARQISQNHGNRHFGPALESPEAGHIFDQFHIAMKLTVLDRYAKGLVHHDRTLGEEIRDKLERLKWALWHGKKRSTKSTSKRRIRSSSCSPKPWRSSASPSQTTATSSRIMGNGIGMAKRLPRVSWSRQ